MIIHDASSIEILKTVIHSALDGDSGLFCGAGASNGSTNILDNNIPLAKDLAKELFTAAKYDGDGSLGWASEVYQDTFSTSELINVLINSFSTKENGASTEIQQVLSIPWKGIYTTNYDDSIEEALRMQGKNSFSVNADSKPSEFSNKRNLIVHLNGSIQDLKLDEEIPRSFLLSDISYAYSNFTNSGWYRHLQSDFVTSEYFFFVGFSMRSDLDIQRIAVEYKESALKQKLIFIVREDEPSSNINFLNKFGRVWNIGMSGFADVISFCKKEHLKKINKPKFFSFQLFNKDISAPSQSAADSAFQLLFKGNSHQSLIEQSIYGKSKTEYYINRSAIKRIIQSINDYEKNILIIAGLGNGKTMLLEGLKFYLLSQNYQIATFNKWYDSTPNEIIEICENWSNPVVIVEGYSRASKVLESLETRRGKRLILITTERKAIHETSFNKLQRIIGEDYATFDLDILDDQEIDEFSNILTVSSAWGDMSNFTAEDKYNFIKNECHSSIRSVLLQRLSSPHILRRFNNILSDIKEKKNYYEAIVFILTSNIININVDLELIISVFNDTRLRKPAFQQDPSIKELIDFEGGGNLKVNSSIFSEAILSNVEDKVELIEILTTLFKQFDTWLDDLNIKQILRELVSYSNILRIIGSQGDDIKPIEQFFDSIRNCAFCRSNPHYWLQYAILNIEKRELPLAKKQFEAAYSYARRLKHFDTYQLDNQYARFLLIGEIEHGYTSTTMSTFLEAHRILMLGAKPDHNKHYPYKVAQQYPEFYQSLYPKFKKEDKIRFIQCLKDMNNRMLAFLSNVNDPKIASRVRNTSKEISQIITYESRA